MKLEAGKFYLVRAPDQKTNEVLEVLATNVRCVADYWDDSDSVGIMWTKHRNKYVDWRVVTWKSEDNTTWDGEIDVVKEVDPPRHRIKLRQVLTGQETVYKE